MKGDEVRNSPGCLGIVLLVVAVIVFSCAARYPTTPAMKENYKYNKTHHPK